MLFSSSLFWKYGTREEFYSYIRKFQSLKEEPLTSDIVNLENVYGNAILWKSVLWEKHLLIPVEEEDDDDGLGLWMVSENDEYGKVHLNQKQASQVLLCPWSKQAITCRYNRAYLSEFFVDNHGFEKERVRFPIFVKPDKTAIFCFSPFKNIVYSLQYEANSKYTPELLLSEQEVFFVCANSNCEIVFETSWVIGPKFRLQMVHSSLGCMVINT